MGTVAGILPRVLSTVREGTPYLAILSSALAGYIILLGLVFLKSSVIIATFSNVSLSKTASASGSSGMGHSARTALYD